MLNNIKDLSRISKKLLIEEPFYGTFLISMNKVFSTRCNKIGLYVNGLDIGVMINPIYWSNLGESQKMWALQHEILHVAFSHILSYPKFPRRNLYLLCCDIFVNENISNKYKPAEEIVTRELVNNYFGINISKLPSALAYYEYLIEVLNEEDMSLFMQTFGDRLNHDTWYHNYHNSDDKGRYDDYLEEGDKVDDDIILKSIEAQIEYMLRVTYSSTSTKGVGSLPGALVDIIEGLFEHIPPVIDWKAFLRRFVSNSNETFSSLTRRKESKRFPDAPGIKTKEKLQIAVAIDTSGSIKTKELVEFFGQIIHIQKTGCSVDIIECDATIHRTYPLKQMPDTKIFGGGGTDFQPVIDYVNENVRKYTCLIYFTDGYAPVPTRCKVPTMWLVSHGGNVNKKLQGSVIEMQPIND